MVKQKRKPHRFKKRKPIYRYRFFWLGILILIFLSSFFYFLFLTDFFQIKKVNLIGFEQVSEEQLILLIERKLENRILFFPTRTIFLINFKEIKETALKTFPQIAEIEIRRNFPDNLNVSIVERKKIAIFCPSRLTNGQVEADPPVGEAGQGKTCFSLDKDSVIFEQAVDYSFEPIIKDFIFDGEIILGEKVIKKEDLISILEIDSYLKENLNLPIKEFIISAREKLIVQTNEDWELYFNLTGDIKWQLVKLKVLLEEKISQGRRKDLEYIELRFGNFANPKYKD